MGMTYLLAEFETGLVTGLRLPLEGVRLTSRLTPDSFTASLDLRRVGTMKDGQSLVERLRWGTHTLVPVLDGTVLGEWWIADVDGTHRDPVIRLSGPEFAGYTGYLLNADPWKGLMDPIATAREMLRWAFTYSQNVRVDLGSWSSTARVEVDVRHATTRYIDAIADLQENPTRPFEWVIRTALSSDGSRVVRTLDVGQPVLAVNQPGWSLHLTGPGKRPSSVLDQQWSYSESRSVTDVTGFGAGAGDDQIGPVWLNRKRQPGEPGKSRMVTDRSAMTRAQVERRVREALRRMTPEEKVQQVPYLVEAGIPALGDVGQWTQGESWTQRATSGRRRLTGWSWQDRTPKQMTLELVEA